MKPDIETLRAGCPETEQAFLEGHLARLDDRYFSRFAEKEVIQHVRGLSGLTAEQPVRLLLRAPEGGEAACTVLAYDYPSEFSIITGILAGMGFSILSGDVFTYERVAPRTPEGPGRGRTRGGRVRGDPIKRRRIIDHFTGLPETPLTFETWAGELRERMSDIIGLLERGDESSVTEAKHRVNEMVVKRLAHIEMDRYPVLYPMQIEVDNGSGPLTRLKVVSEDTPAFLYALSNALSLQGILIEQVRIQTIRGRVEDQIDLCDLSGNQVTDPDLLERLKLSVLLTKQFTYFLGKAPDPYAALSRFEHLLGEILDRPREDKWLEMVTGPETLQALARLLGASDFLWEDFIRLQYETLLPMLQPPAGGRRFSGPVETLPRRLDRALEGAPTFEDRQRALNEFKDREIFLIDLDYILDPEVDFRILSERLTRLGEVVADRAARMVYDRLVKEFGTPRTIAGLEAKYAVLGLGKLGGAALGYASDIELLFVYGDNGQSDGRRAIRNAEFFDRLVRGVNRLIKAKREGIFHVDLRLRPHGNAGPLACSLESFCSYHGRGGRAHAYERLALVRLRAIGGDAALGRQVERLRDEIVYFSDRFDIAALRALREKQFREKTRPGTLNAKFSPGGLVDLEYSVQILQVMYGRDFPQLRTPRTHESLRELTEANILSHEQAAKLVAAYDFLRHLINGMRMLRGSAKDLFLPSVESKEFSHLARRMGYDRGGPLDPAQQLRIDFETHTATVRLFVERFFGRESLPAPGAGTVVDLIISDEMPPEIREHILRNTEFRDSQRAFVNFRKLAGDGRRRDIFARLALLACDILARVPDPDMALNNWERFIHSLASPEFHYSMLLSQPMRLEILLKVFSGSQFLSDTLVRHPGFLDWVMIPEMLHRVRNRQDMLEDLRTLLERSGSHPDWLNSLRRFRRREMLRIGTRDMCLGVPTEEVMLELSGLAEAVTQAALEGVWRRLRKEEKVPEEIGDPESAFCVLALGKLGGEELNYSSDIDLLGIWNDGGYPDAAGSGGPLKGLFTRVMEDLRSDLSGHTGEGHAYRVDLRLRPFGQAGELVPALSGLIRYYGDRASLWEIQASLKMRPVAGNLGLGHAFLREIRPLLLRRRDRGFVAASVERMRNAGLKGVSGGAGNRIDVKSGLGGLRDVEFLVQGLQLIHAPETPGILEGNTLRALGLLGEARLLPEGLVDQLKGDYNFLRRVEHYLQILEDRQIHTLPSDPVEIDALAKRILGVHGRSERFMEELRACLHRTRTAYRDYLSAGALQDARSSDRRVVRPKGVPA
jgi:glutamate-ammonia-ligase adenylyltransferase